MRLIKIYEGDRGFYWTYSDEHLVDGPHGPWPSEDDAHGAAHRHDTSTDRADDPGCVAYVQPGPELFLGAHELQWFISRRLA